MYGMTENITAVRPVPFTHLLKTEFQYIHTTGQDCLWVWVEETKFSTSPLGFEMIFFLLRIVNRAVQK